METSQIRGIIEAVLFAADQPLTVQQLQELFVEETRPPVAVIREILGELRLAYLGAAIELKEVATGFRLQILPEYSPWVAKLWQERPARYSRALLETLAIIAYRQPVSRAEIEDIRGVTVSSSILKTLTEREWIQIVGHKDLPGKPAVYATTKKFLDYFNLASLKELPSLAALTDMEQLTLKLTQTLQEELVIDELSQLPEADFKQELVVEELETNE